MRKGFCGKSHGESWGEKSGKISADCQKPNEIKSYWHFEPARRKSENERNFAMFI